MSTEGEREGRSLTLWKWKRIPPRLFGGRMRTTTVAMCVLWLGLAWLNADLNPSTDTTPATAPTSGQYNAPVRQEPAQTTWTPTESPSAPPVTSDTTPPTSAPPVSGSQSPTSSTTESGTTEGGRESATTGTTGGTTRVPGTTTTAPALQNREPGNPVPGTESTTAPSPQG